MSHQCPFPVESSDNRCGYRTGSAPGFIFCLALVAVLFGYAGISEATQTNPSDVINEISVSSGFVRG